MFGGRVLRRAAALPDAGQERAGSARSDSPDRFPPRAEPARTHSRQRRSENLRVDLEAHDGVADGRRARAADDRRDLREGSGRRRRRADRERQGDRIRRLPPRLRRRQRRSGRGARRAGSDPAAVQGRAIRSIADGTPYRCCSTPSRSGTRRLRRRASRKRRSSRSWNGSASGGRPRSRRRSRRSSAAATSSARARRWSQLHGVRGDQAAARALRRFRRDRLHRRNGGGPRRDLARRARVDRIPPRVLLRRQEETSRPARRRRTRARRTRTIRCSISASDPRDGEPVRIRIGRFGPFVQVGEGGPAARASLPDDIAAGGSDARQGARTRSRQGRRATLARRRSRDGHERLRHEWPLRRVRAAWRDAGRRARKAREAEARVAAVAG